MAPISSTTTDLGARRLLDVREAAELTGLSPRSVRQMFDERRVPLVRLGRTLRVWSDDLAAYLDACTLPAREGVAR
ncbi:helix-turn-helix domain-containing protein [Leucobacter sp. gxy201]|uniref:helix-turn-helix domain-containing protein n=1 Tax=Leucobacter sp. gxy201 TaxID=2957200 RepID=UPI003DA06966